MKRRVARARQSLALMIAIAMYCVSGGALVQATGNTDSNGIARLRAKAVGTFRLHDQTARNDAARSNIIGSLGRVPVSFEPNQGQADPRVKFIARGGGYNLFLSSTEMTFAFSKAKGSDLGLVNDAKTGSMRETINSQSQVCDIRASTLRMKVVGANQKAEIKAADELASSVL